MAIKFGTSLPPWLNIIHMLQVYYIIPFVYLAYIESGAVLACSGRYDCSIHYYITSY